MLGVVMHNYNPSTWEAEAGELKVGNQKDREGGKPEGLL
jgi:hypothetical protein